LKQACHEYKDGPNRSHYKGALILSVTFSKMHGGYTRRLTGDIYTDFLTNKLLAFLENIPVHTQLHMY